MRQHQRREGSREYRLPHHEEIANFGHVHVVCSVKSIQICTLHRSSRFGSQSHKSFGTWCTSQFRSKLCSSYCIPLLTPSMHISKQNITTSTWSNSGKKWGWMVYTVLPSMSGGLVHNLCRIKNYQFKRLFPGKRVGGKKLWTALGIRNGHFGRRKPSALCSNTYTWHINWSPRWNQHELVEQTGAAPPVCSSPQ